MIGEVECGGCNAMWAMIGEVESRMWAMIGEVESRMWAMIGGFESFVSW